MGVHFHFIEQGSDEWLEARKGMYTGSNSYKLLGNLGWVEYAKAIASDFKGNFWTKRGHLLEDEAIELYEQITGTKVLRDETGTKVGFITNDKYIRCLYSPDGVPPVPLLEVKSFSPINHLKLINGDIDLKIMAQIQYGLTISERPYAELLPYNPMFAKRKILDEATDELVDNKLYDPSKAFKIIRVPRNKAAIANFSARLKEAASYG